MPLERHTLQLFLLYMGGINKYKAESYLTQYSSILSVNKLEKVSLNAKMYIFIYNKHTTVTHILKISKRP